MAFQNKNLNCLMMGSFTIWHYRTTEDTIQDIETTNYFGVLWTLAALGDVLYITDKNGRTHVRQVIKLGNEECVIGKLDE